MAGFHFYCSFMESFQSSKKIAHTIFSSFVYFKSAADHYIGDFVSVKIEKSSDYDLYGSIVEG